MNLERIDEIIVKNITITDQSLYEGVFNAVLEAVNEENEACADICRAYAMPDGTSVTAMVLEKAIRARGKV